MSWTHSSKGTALGVLLAVGLAVALGVAGPAAAVTLSGDTPDAAEVGEEVSMEATLEDPFDGQPDSWTLQGTTELDNASWTIEIEDVGGDARTVSASGETASADLDVDEGVSEVRIRVTGSVPEMESFNYEEQEEEEYVVMAVTNGGSGETLEGGEFTAHRFTEGSQEARAAIDSASAAVEESGGDGQGSLDDAIEAYNAGEFELAVSVAEDAESEASGATQTRQLLLIGGGVVVVVALLGGGIYYYRKQQQDSYKLQ